jgi:glycosyltransferase involved in cell wall biosynthesis
MRKRIIICCNVYPPHFIGGAELIAHDHAKVLKNLGHEVIIFAGDTQGHGERHSLRKDTYDGLTVYRVTLTWKDFDQSSFNFAHKKVEEHFNNILNSLSPDIVHFHNLIGLSVGLIHIAKQKKFRTVLTLHDHWGFCYKNTLLKDGKNICNNYFKCEECMPVIADGNYMNIPICMRNDFLAMQFNDIDVFISPSQYLADAYIHAGFPEEKFRVIWNGIDVNRFENILKIRGIAGVRFTFIGYFGTHKGIDILLDALPLIGKNHRFVVNLIGTGELFEKYKQQVKSMGFEDIVKFWGRIDKIDRAYSETDVLILPSIWPENQPVTITEAMASRIPVIVSNIGGNPELIEDGNTGYLFEPANPRDLASKMLEFISNPGKIITFGDNAHSKIKSNTFENQISKIIKIYNDKVVIRKRQMQEETLVACIGHNISPMCAKAMRSILNNKLKNQFRFLPIEWLQKDQVPLAKLLWIVGDDINAKDVTEELKNKIPIIVPENNAKLKALCIEWNCGLYYRDDIEAEACLEYLAENEAIRDALGRHGFKFYWEKCKNRDH